MSACRHFFESFGSAALEQANELEQHKKQWEQKEKWWKEYYEAIEDDKDNREDYELCPGSCSTPWDSVLEGFGWECGDGVDVVCTRWCGRDGCHKPEWALDCQFCAGGVCRDCLQTCEKCNQQMCNTCLLDSDYCELYHVIKHDTEE